MAVSIIICHFFLRLLSVLGMPSQTVIAPPYIPGLFTNEGSTNDTRSWEALMRGVSQCFVGSVTWYKERSGVQHEFLHFYIRSADGGYWSTVIAERGKVDSPLVASSSSFSSTSTSDGVAADMVFAATSGTTGATDTDRRCAAARAICRLTFPGGNGPSAHQLSMLLAGISKVKEKYRLLASQCYWFSATGFEALRRLFPGAVVEDIRLKQKGKCYGLPIPFACVVDEVCTAYEAKRQEMYGGVYHGPADPTHY